MSLRPYQEQGVSEIREHFKNGAKKVLLHLATGGGKTVVFSYIMKRMAESGKRCTMVVRGRKLVDQASQRLFRENVYHGVMMAKHWNNQPLAPIQICSIDTLIARGLTPPSDLIVIDEAHYAISPGYHKFLENYPNALILAVTATPYVQKSLRHIAEVMVKPVTVQELIDQGFLVPPRYFAPTDPDLTDVRVSKMTGDYDQSELASVMDSGALVGDIVHHWKNLGQNRPTICFATSVEHSKNIVQQFRSAGIWAEHCDDGTKDEERVDMLTRLETGKTKIISNVGILGVGVDLPFLGCIIMARPTKSYNLYIQQAGRGTRPAPGKNDFILLDHAGNILRHGFITDEPEASLDGRAVKLEKTPKTCSSCFAVFYGFNCECGFVQPEGSAKRQVVDIAGKLVEISELPEEMQILRDVKWFKEEAKKRGFKQGWAYYKIRDKWGEEIANAHFKKRQMPAWMEFDQPPLQLGE